VIRTEHTEPPCLHTCIQLAVPKEPLLHTEKGWVQGVAGDSWHEALGLAGDHSGGVGEGGGVGLPGEEGEAPIAEGLGDGGLGSSRGVPSVARSEA